MAATWIKSIHAGGGRGIARVITARLNYAMNPGKTEGGELVTGYACDPRTATEEFLLTRREYDYIIGRTQANGDVVLYHIRQSFKPGEIDAETANEIGRKLVLSFTKSRHQFIVATHTDKAHIHNHIIVSAVAVSCDKKFRDFIRSGRAVRRISDLLCLEYGLSVIENPKPSKGKNYAEWLGEKASSWQEKLRQKIDEILPSCATFEDFISTMKAAGYKVNDKRKHITFLALGQKKPTRLNTLKGDHTEEAIRERLSGARIITAGGASGGQTLVAAPIFTQHAQPSQVSFLIDIQSKIREGKGAGYEQWARIFNLKEASKTLLFLKENGIDNYEELVKKSSSASGDFAILTKKIKAAETRMEEISALQKHIGTYGKTREIFSRYKKSGYSEKFYEENRADITLHRAAKKHFDDLGYDKDKKLPTINSLKQEYAMLLAEKKKMYAGYHAAKKNMQALAVAKGNADRILGITAETQSRDTSRAQTLSNTHER